MKHLKIYESFVGEAEPEIGTQEVVDNPEMGHFETESTNFVPTKDDEEGDYVVTFTNADGEDTTIYIGHANEPEYVGKSMISSIDMIPDSSSDGKEYSVVGYYDEISGSDGAYELKKVLIEG